MIDRLSISGNRSIRSIILEMGPLNVVTGANGSGKSNLYRALRLLADTADGRLVHSLAHEGGFSSTLWAGPETISSEMINGEVPVQGTVRKKPVRLRMGFVAEPFSYTVDLGLPPPSGSAFTLDPEMKRECVWRGATMRAASMCADRRRNSLRCRGEKGRWQDIDLSIPPQSSMLTEYSDPVACPELILTRDILHSWRFYDTFRTDPGAPARRTSVGTLTPVMSDDGSDLAAALQTIREVGDSHAMDQIIDDAFPGARVVITHADSGMALRWKQPGMLRDLSAAEISDGTLRFLLLVAALLTPRPPELMVINEPETSLHPELIPALGRLIVAAAQQSQLIVVTHSDRLIDELSIDGPCEFIRLEKRLGETILEGSTALNQFGWKWPAS